jgi:SPOR domain
LMRFFLILLFSCAIRQSIAQDTLVNQLVDKQKQLNSLKMSMPGYRIQIYFGGERLRANNLRSDFLQEYPEIGAYVIYQQPNFKLRVGDFKTRLEAAKFLTEMQARFNMAFIVSDEVKLPELD